MKEIITRTLTGIVFIVTIIGSMLIHPLVFFGVMGVYSVIGLFEFYKLTIKSKISILAYIIGILSYCLIGLVGLNYIDILYLTLLIPLVFLVITSELFSNNGSWINAAFYLTSFVYITLPFGLMNHFFYLPSIEPSILVLLGLFILVWTSDVFAYLSGSFLGKHKLFKRISPKKTWEGSFGGLLFALIGAYLFYFFSGSYSLATWVVYAGILVVTATIGDLAESMLKRNAEVKDSGTIFPGHGGVLDRFDAVLFATPFAYVFLNFVL